MFPLSPADAHPQVSYVIEHGGQDIALHVELGRHDRPPRGSLPTIRIDQLADRAKRYARIRTTQSELIRDFHDFLCAVSDRIVTHDRSLDQAYAETVRAWQALLDKPRGLGVEKRIGLIGELAVLRSLSTEYGWAPAIESWTGPSGEEHDFGLPGHDLEVKTTASEHRRHTIHGVGQLTPTSERPLWLASLHLTRGGTSGRTLAACVRAVRAEVAEHAPASLSELDRQLSLAGWSDDAPDDERWTPRSPLLLLNAAGLPRLDMSVLPEAARERISSVQYTIDVTDLPASPQPPSSFADFRLP
ncbi:PD-(D/E)XK motif protein [Streptomyces sp. NBC_01003]|uniref:PD-(D/E)XK motif protein n=1 Tax=Streptomyces sp. NBC_01003 TaxID=2903714 RepID=UPI00386F9941|nr:PD-(D/E)XK motif protein [Streptomyces sp. NBC_01003]